jgi:hypothetical protein
MIKTALLLLITIVSGFVFEQTFTTNAIDFRLDQMGNIYYIYDNKIEKCGPAGQLLFRTSDLNAGRIEYLDVTNPLKPFIYYKDQSKLVVLDNTLSAQGNEIDLYDQGFGQVELVAASRGDAYWLWDVNTVELVRTNQQFQRINSTGNLATLLGRGIYPTQLIERGDFVYLNDPKEGIIIFDIYGNYRTRIQLGAEGNIQVVDDNIIFKKNGELHILEKDLITETKITLPEAVNSDFYYFKNKLYFLGQGGLRVYRLEG